MVTPQLLHFAVLSITYTLTATGYKIVCVTNNPCHLFMRYSTTPPQKHIHHKMVRGAPVGTYIDQCFVAYHDNEQEEPGNTITHTFIKEHWPGCQTRWFYFWGTVAGELSPSASPIFIKHRPVSDIFYPDPGSGLTTCDGYVARSGVFEPFAVLRAGAGTMSDTGGGRLYAQIQSTHVPNLWLRLRRSILTFNLGTIPANHTITAASFFWWGMAAYFEGLVSVCVAVFTASPVSANNLSPADYGNCGTTPLTNEISAGFFRLRAYNEFMFTPSGLKALKPGAINALALRESRYDAGGENPHWIDERTFGFNGRSADYSDISERPYLKIWHKSK